MKYLLRLSYALVFLTLPTLSFASYSSLENYLDDMKSKKLPSVLIVGCGHYSPSLEGDHSHPNCWTVDVTDPYDFAPESMARASEKRDKTPHWNIIKADAEFDISTPLGIPKNYQNKFDTVVLERNWPTTLNKMWTLYNAATMLKTDGELIVDVHKSYHYDSYDPAKIESLASQVNPSHIEGYKGLTLGLTCLSAYGDSLNEIIETRIIEQLDNITRPVNAKRVIKKLTRFGFKPTYEGQLPLGTKELSDVASYLEAWGFEEAMALINAYQPYTAPPEGELTKTARKGNLVVATKSTQTQELMESWHSLIKKYEVKKY